MGDCELAEVLVGSCIASGGLLALGDVAKACPVLHLMHSLCCTGQPLEARPGLISEASDNQGYTGLAWRLGAKTCSKLDPGCLGWLTRVRPMCESVCESVSVSRSVCVWCVVVSVSFLLHINS